MAEAPWKFEGVDKYRDAISIRFHAKKGMSVTIPIADAKRLAEEILAKLS